MGIECRWNRLIPYTKMILSQEIIIIVMTVKLQKKVNT